MTKNNKVTRAARKRNDSEVEKQKKLQAQEGKSYLLKNEENERRRKFAETEGSEYIELKSSNRDKEDGSKADWDKAQG